MTGKTRKAKMIAKLTKKMKKTSKTSQKTKKQVLREVQQWKEDKLLKITGFFGSESLDVVEGDLAYYPEDKQICLRKLQRDKELKVTSGGRNLYEILGLYMAKVRKMSKEEQKQAIRRGYHTQIRRWHPDNNCGDEEIAKEIILAYKILEDEDLRARYNNLTDYMGIGVGFPGVVTKQFSIPSVSMKNRRRLTEKECVCLLRHLR